MTTTIMMKLGLVLQGSSADLRKKRPDEDSSSDDEGTGADESEDTDEESEDGEGSGDSDEDAEGSDDDTDGEDSDGSGDSDEDEDADDADGSGSDDEEEHGEPDPEDPIKAESEEGDGAEDEEGDEPDDVDDGEKTELDLDAEGGDDESDDGDSGGDDDDGDGDGTGDGHDANGEASDDEGDPGGEADSNEDREAGGGEHGDHSDVDQDDGIAQELLEQMEEVDRGEAETGLTDNNDALGDAIGSEADEECLDNEQVWRPYNPDLDEVKMVHASQKSTGSAQWMLNKVKKQVSFIANKLRSKFLQARQPRAVHGVRKGRDLSERRLVNSIVELRAGRRPTRPDWMNVKKEECSLAAAVVIDQSGSMSGSLQRYAAMGSIAVASALDRLGSPCLVVGPRNGGNGYGYNHYSSGGYSSPDYWAEDEDGSRRPLFHRDDGVIIDVFKDWDESMQRSLGRFGRVQACGSTPLSDGIQYAMQELNDRPERFRVIFVVTDGYPDNRKVVTRQIRIAAEAGVFIIGVGIGPGASAVRRVFPLHVAVPNVDALPNDLLSILDGIMFPKHGRRIALDGRYKKTGS